MRELVHLLADQLFRLVAEHLGAPPVDEGDRAIRIESVDAFAGCVEQLADVRLEPLSFLTSARRSVTSRSVPMVPRTRPSSRANDARARLDPTVAARHIEVAHLDKCGLRRCRSSTAPTHRPRPRGPMDGHTTGSACRGCVSTGLPVSVVHAWLRNVQ